jgi:hypothetical protein
MQIQVFLNFDASAKNYVTVSVTQTQVGAERAEKCPLAR